MLSRLSNFFDILQCSYLDTNPLVEKTTPNFKYTTLGGNGTLPGYKFNEFSGNRALLNRSIVSFNTIGLTDINAIFDFGEAYEFNPNSSGENLFDGLSKFSTKSLKSSFGIGLSYGDNFMFSIHKRLDTNEDPYQLQFLAKHNL